MSHSSASHPLRDPSSEVVSRRTFLARSTAAAATLAALGASPAALAAPVAPRKRIAIVTTVWRYLSHGQHMGDRFLVGWPEGDRWHRPDVDVVSVYVDQRPEGDLTAARAEEFGFSVQPSIAAALRNGGKEIAVDGVLVIGEHGDYPKSEFGQRQYPRYEFFRQIADVVRADGRPVPVFNDKHLSWKWEWAKEMVDVSRELKIPLQAGSSLPGTWRMPSIDMPAGAVPREVMSLAYGGVDSYDFHALETIQCMAERRRGGETGVAWVEAVRGEAAWKVFDAGSWERGGFDGELFEACLCRSQQLTPPRPGFNHRRPTREELGKMVADPVIYRFEYRDGLRGTMLLMNGLVRDFTFAARLPDSPRPLSTLFHLPPEPNVTYSAELMSKAERLFVSGKTVYPIERTLLTSGLLAAAVECLATGKRRETPHLAIRYEPPRGVQFLQG